MAGGTNNEGAGACGAGTQGECFKKSIMALASHTEGADETETAMEGPSQEDETDNEEPVMYTGAPSAHSGRCYLASGRCYFGAILDCT